MPRESLLKVLLRRRHLQTHAAFSAAYEKTAKELDRDLIGTAPGREQLQRWLSARVKTVPRAHHCRVLERMFPGYRTEELLAVYGEAPSPQPYAGSSQQGAATGAAVPSPTAATLTATPRAAAAPAEAGYAAPGGHDAPGHAAMDHTGRARAGTDRTTADRATAHRAADHDQGPGPHAAPILWQGADHLEQVLDSATVGSGRLGYLHTEADRLGVQVVRVPPSTLLESTLVQLRGVHSLLADRQPVTVSTELARIASKLAMVVAEILWNENHLPLATRWYQAAFRAASEASDRTLADLALAGSTYIPAYTEHPRTVLDNVDPRLTNAAAGRPASPALAWLWAFKARAHATLGERNEFEHAVESATRTLEHAPASLIHPGIFSFLPEKLAFYEAHGRVELGDWRGAIEAAERALASYDPTETTEPTLTRLELASAVAQRGELAEACELATLALRDPGSYHSASVVLQARAFDRRLGPTTRATAGWREFLTGIHPPDAAALAPSV